MVGSRIYNKEGRGTHGEKSVRGGNTRGERRRGRPNTSWKDACRRDMRIVELREDDGQTEECVEGK